jgi:hypothetical protein
MRIFSVIHIIGFLLMFLAGAMLLPLPFPCTTAITTSRRC